jgi:hypothetical protein
MKLQLAAVAKSQKFDNADHPRPRIAQNFVDLARKDAPAGAELSWCPRVETYIIEEE